MEPLRAGPVVLDEVLAVAEVAGGRAVRHAGSYGIGRGQGDGPVLEERLTREGQVVHDHVGPGGREVLDGVGHLEAGADAREE